MKSTRLLSLIGVLCLASTAMAQTAPTRATACNAATPWNAVCIEWTAPTKYTDGSDIPASDVLTYKVERSATATGTFATQAATVSGNTAYMTNLAAGVHYFRVIVRSTAFSADSAPSNVANKGVTSGVPNPAVITIAVLVDPTNQPVVMELTAKRDGSYRCAVLASPRRLNLRSACQASVS